MNPLHAGLFGDPEIQALLSPEAEIAAMIRVEAALAEVQGRLGLIPTAAAREIAAACAALTITPDSLSEAAAKDGVPVPGLVKAMRAAIGGEAAQYLHWGATSQDIVDTALALRLRDMLSLWEGRLAALTAALARLADEHADLPMAARTYAQVAVPTSFGAVAAGWGWPLLDHTQALEALRPRLLRVSLSGAAGTLSAMGPGGPEVRAALAEALDLSDPGRSWHSDRAGVVALAGWAAGLAASLGKLAEDLLLMTQSGLALVRIEGAGGSSTMPQKQNPVGPSALAALSRATLGAAAVLQGTGAHRQQRDGAAWFTEWLVLPQLALGIGAMLLRASEVLARLSPDPLAMAADLEAGHGTIHAEALTFAVTEAGLLPRDRAASRIGALSRLALAEGRELLTLAEAEWPGIDWRRALHRRMLGTAPDEARAFRQAAGTGRGGRPPSA
ncbi:lyase family protein [Paracoccus sp. (in: a-proteobacteria)]|uniref:lyase family protein n=1 Tax=Paracoccus sp. TaxID=267 RepID=UPI00272AB712|nr:lyase family protein [Paracoccus sp. (in: a-proteobacteria)]